MSHILFFSDLITKYGGTPRFTPWPVNQNSDIKDMLKSDIALEKKARERYRAQLERFTDYPELAGIVQNVLDDEGDHEALFAGYLARLANSAQ
jgi:rubrerythrin